MNEYKMRLKYQLKSSITVPSKFFRKNLARLVVLVNHCLWSNLLRQTFGDPDFSSGFYEYDCQKQICVSSIRKTISEIDLSHKTFCAKLFGSEFIVTVTIKHFITLVNTVMQSFFWKFTVKCLVNFFKQCRFI